MIKRLLKCYWPLLLPVLGCLLLIAMAGSPLLMKKVIAFLILPAGMIWVLLAFAMVWPRQRLVSRLFFIGIWMLYTLAGSPLVGSKLMSSLEKPYVSFANPEEPFDVLFLLGGGTNQSAAAQPQAGTSGDRVVNAARLFNRGKAVKLVASGRSVTEVKGDRDLSAETKLIWTELGVPADRIHTISEPRNTEEEINAYIDYLASLTPRPQRVGISTSAWHLKRTLKLCERKGLEVIPVPADFRSSPIPIISQYLIPQRRGFTHVQMALWEYLGYWTG